MLDSKGGKLKSAILRATALGLATLLVFADASLAQSPPPAAQAPAAPILKRKVAITRFSNSTRYGRALLLATERDPVADQAADMLMARLVDSGKFLVFERSDGDALAKEQSLAGDAKAGPTGVDAVIVGSVTEFGRKTEGHSGFLNSKMKQTATATVEVRLVDVRTGLAFFSTKGTGSASLEVGETAGFGQRAGYDATLNDKAISAAISDLTNNVIQKLGERRWFSDVLAVRGPQIFVSGGPAQGLRVGDRFRVETRGEVVKSGQSGLPITLPGEAIGTVEVVSFFGDDPQSQGAITRVVDGQLGGRDPKTLIVVEPN
jgi:curli biogenesis system outer membrane secretion channel CsgG